MNPFLSVIMPCYNGERFIAAALESVRTQYRDGIELLVIDDGSQDRTLEIVRDFARSTAHANHLSRQNWKLGSGH